MTPQSASSHTAVGTWSSVRPCTLQTLHLHIHSVTMHLVPECKEVAVVIIIIIIIMTQEIGRRTTAVTGDPLETIHLFQHLSIAIQQANAVSFTSTFKSE